MHYNVNPVVMRYQHNIVLQLEIGYDLCLKRSVWVVDIYNIMSKSRKGEGLNWENVSIRELMQATQIFAETLDQNISYIVTTDALTCIMISLPLNFC